MKRLKQMTVQQLLDMGFNVDVNKFGCGVGKASVMLEARQFLDSPEFCTSDYRSTVWAEQHDKGLRVTFFGG